MCIRDRREDLPLAAGQGRFAGEEHYDLAQVARAFPRLESSGERVAPRRATLARARERQRHVRGLLPALRRRDHVLPERRWPCTVHAEANGGMRRPQWRDDF